MEKKNLGPLFTISTDRPVFPWRRIPLLAIRLGTCALKYWLRTQYLFICSPSEMINFNAVFQNNKSITASLQNK